MIHKRTCASEKWEERSCKNTWKCAGSCRDNLRISAPAYCLCWECLDEEDSEPVIDERKSMLGSDLTIEQLKQFCYPTEDELVALEMLE